MKINGNRVAVLAAGIAVCLAQGAYAVEKEQDSAYRWGRWAVLSPAAGGAEPYVAATTPGANFNARPGDASEFEPVVTLSDTSPTPPIYGPPVVVPNPPGNPPPVGGPRDTVLPETPGVVQNPPGATPPVGGPRGG